MDYKMYKMDLLKPLCISLNRLEDNRTGNIITQQQFDSDITEIYYNTDITEPYAEPVNYNDSTEIYNTERDSETERKKEKVSAVKKQKGRYARHSVNNTTNTKKEKTKKRTTKHENTTKLKKLKKQTFLCRSKNCTSRSNSRKELYLHYKTTHKRVHKCKNCKKQYKTPYGLKQHNYKHR